MQILFFIFILILTFVFLSGFPRIEAKRAAKFLHIAIGFWVILLVILFLLLKFGASDIWDIIGVCLFVSYNAAVTLLIKACSKKSIKFIALFIPISILLFVSLLKLNSLDWLIIVLYFYVLLISYPFFLLSLVMLNIKNYIKGIILIIISTTCGFGGISQTIGKEGYLADSTGYFFAATILLLFITGIYLILNKWNGYFSRRKDFKEMSIR